MRENQDICVKVGQEDLEGTRLTIKCQFHGSICQVVIAEKRVEVLTTKGQKSITADKWMIMVK